jgi:hypothetical protein
MATIATLSALAASGCLSVDAEVPEMQVKRHDLVFEGVPETPGVAAAVTETFTHRHSPLWVPDGIQSEIRATEVTLEARQGTPELSFIEGLLLVTSADEQGSAEPEVVLAYERAEQVRVGQVLSMPARSTTNLAELWQTDATHYELTVWGMLPAQSWSVDVTVTFSGSFSYEL